MAPRTSRTARKRKPASAAPSSDKGSNYIHVAKWTYDADNDPTSPTGTVGVSGIDTATVTDEAARVITARQQAIQALRVLGGELRAVLAHIESQHEQLTSGYNPPMAGAKADVAKLHNW